MTRTFRRETSRSPRWRLPRQPAGCAIRTAALLLAAAGLAPLGAQTLTFDKPALSLTGLTGGSPVAETVTVASGGVPTPFFIYASIPWLDVSPMGDTTPSTLTLTANPRDLAPGVYTAQIPFTVGTAVAATLSVTFTVSTISAFPASAAFVFQAGGAAPAPQSFTLTGQPAPYTASATSVGNWLQVTPQSGNSPGAVTATVNQAVAQGLSAGTYSGAIRILPESGQELSIPAKLKVLAAPEVRFSATALAFLSQQGAAGNQTTQSLQLTTNATQPVSYAVTGVRVDANSANKTWLTAIGSGAVPGPVSVSVDPSGLPAGVYNGGFTVMTGGAPASQAVSVRLTVAAGPLLGVPAMPLSFAYQLGGAVPAARSVAVQATSGPMALALSASADGGNWLIAPSTATTGSSFSVSVNPAGLTVGTYAGSIAVSAAGAVNSPQQIRISLKVSNDPAVAADAAALAFPFQIGQTPPPARTVKITDVTGLPLAYTAAADSTSCGGGWLMAVPATGITDDSLTVSVNPAGIAAGSACVGSIRIEAMDAVTGAAAANSPLVLPVTMYVDGAPLLTVSPATPPVFSAASGSSAGTAQNCGAGAPVVCTVLLASTNTSDPLSLEVSPPAGVYWLSVAFVGNSTPNSLRISTAAERLPPGVYSANIAVKATRPGKGEVVNSPFLIPVTLRVTSGALMSSAGALSFTQVAGGPAPDSQAAILSSAGAPLNYTLGVSAAGGWLTAAPALGVTPAAIVVQADGSQLAPATYQGTVAVSAFGPLGAPAAGSPLVIPVALKVVKPVTLTATPASLSFSYAPGGAAPRPQTVQLGGGDIPFSTQVSGGSWLQVSPVSGGSLAALSVSVNPQGLADGVYRASIAITSPDATAPASVAVTLTVATQPLPGPVDVKNAASYARGAVSPGENIVIFGDGIGPPAIALGSLTQGNRFDTAAGGTRVLFDGVAAPVIYAFKTQTSVMAPYEIAGRTATKMRVEYQGLQSPEMTLSVASSAPGIYAVNQQGFGLGAILNQDIVNGRYVVNGPDAPAARGSVVQVFMTGEGLTDDPHPSSGGIAPVNGAGLFRPLVPVTATVDGLPANVGYAGSAPGLVYGVMQVNVEVPAAAHAGEREIVITMGPAGSVSPSTQRGITVWLR